MTWCRVTNSLPSRGLYVKVANQGPAILILAV
jgi:hypothetical protein